MVDIEVLGIVFDMFNFRIEVCVVDMNIGEFVEGVDFNLFDFEKIKFD